jgi:hypothetical protein
MWHTLERREKCTAFWWESPEEKGPLGNLGVDRRMESKWILERLSGWGAGVDSVDSYRDWWWAFANALMNLWVLAPWSYLVTYW